jgi:hypothetical protein
MLERQQGIGRVGLRRRVSADRRGEICSPPFSGGRQQPIRQEVNDLPSGKLVFHAGGRPDAARSLPLRVMPANAGIHVSLVQQAMVIR